MNTYQYYSSIMESRPNYSVIDPKWQQIWNEHKCFEKHNINKPKYTIVEPPCNVTGTMHFGHALNNIIQDIIIRYKRMDGFDTLWIPGTDHAGVSCQHKVISELEKKKITNLSNDELLKEIWEWKEISEKTITNQIKKLGCSCDWSYYTFTLDPHYCKIVRDVFCKLYKDNMIVKKNYIVNWCCKLKTTLSDEEVIKTECMTDLYHINYKYTDKDGHITIATTRPETMFGDVALVVNSNDERYANLIGEKVFVPIINRVIPIIGDLSVDTTFGTGVVKVTPAHDKTDYEIGERHNLEIISVINEDGYIFNTNTPYDGLDRFKARWRVLSELTNNNQLVKKEKIKSVSKTCYRSGDIIEPMVTKQWFIKMDTLTKMAKESVENDEIEILPKKYVNIFYDWMNKCHDWCISRQLLWGHRIPCWECNDCKFISCCENDPTCCENCHSNNIIQDKDVLDTWASSWLWSFGVFKDQKDLERYHPTDLLVTGADILFFWVARMIMASKYYLQEIPFKRVYLHGIVRDDQHRKMSKSLGNGIDPLKIIEKFGTDPLRFTLAMITPKEDDLALSTDATKIGMTFCTKLWNITRYCLNEIKIYEKRNVHIRDEHDANIILALNEIVTIVRNSFEKIDIKEATNQIYHYAWDIFANDYLERCKVEPFRNQLLICILIEILKLCHPIIPHITEELYHKIKTQYNLTYDLLCLEEYPKALILENYANQTR